MGFHYKIYDQNKACFVTFTVTDWIDEIVKFAKNNTTTVLRSHFATSNSKNDKFAVYCPIYKY